MKKSKLLIPALSIASVGAIVTPIITSCSKGMEMVDITKAYTPTIAAYEPTAEEKGGVSATAAQKIYFEAAAKNPEIVRQDILTVMCGKGGTGITEAKIGIKIDKITTDGKITGDFKLIEKGKQSGEEIDLTLSLRFENVPMSIEGSKLIDASAFTLLLVGVDPESWSTDAKITATGNGSMTISDVSYQLDNTQLTIDKTFDSSKLSEKQQIVFYIAKTLITQSISSHYLSNLTEI